MRPRLAAVVRGTRVLLEGCLLSVLVSAASLTVQRVAGPLLVLGVVRGERLASALIIVVTATLGLLRAACAERIVRRVRQNILGLHLGPFERGAALEVPRGEAVTPAIAVSTPVAIALATDGLAPLLAAAVAVPVVALVLASAVPPRALAWVFVGALAGALVSLALARPIQRAWSRTWGEARGALEDVAAAFDGAVELRVHGRASEASAAMLSRFEAWSREEGRARRLQTTSTWGTLLAMTSAGGALALLMDGDLSASTELYRVGLLVVSAVPAFQLVLNGGAHLLRARSAVLDAAAIAPPDPPPARSSGPESAWAPSSTIELREVGYAYPSGGAGLAPTGLSVGPGARVAILGGNGSGKSTLLYLLAGMIGPTSGELLVDGRPASWPPGALRIAMVSQRPYERGEGSIAENLRAFEPTLGDAELSAELALLGLWEPLRARVATDEEALALPMASLSQGQRRRVFLARALLSGAELILLDEPEANLDSAAIRLFVRRLHDLGPERRVVAAIHDPSALGWEKTTLRLGEG